MASVPCLLAAIKASHRTGHRCYHASDEAGARRDLAGPIESSGTWYFGHPTGKEILATVLVGQALSRLPGDHGLQEVVNGTLENVTESMRVFVRVLMIGSATPDLKFIEQVMETVSVRFSKNSEALEAIHPE